MAMQNNYLFDGSATIGSRLGHAERRLLDETMLRVVMAYHTWNHTVSLSVYEPEGNFW